MIKQHNQPFQRTTNIAKLQDPSQPRNSPHGAIYWLPYSRCSQFGGEHKPVENVIHHYSFPDG